MIILSETISKKVNEKPSWLWDIQICAFFCLLKGATVTRSSCSHHTFFCGDVDICEVFSSYLRNTVRLHLRLDGFESVQNVGEILSPLDGSFTVTIQSPFSIYNDLQANRKQVPTWIIQPAADEIPRIATEILGWPPIWQILESKSGDIFTFYQHVGPQNHAFIRNYFLLCEKDGRLRELGRICRKFQSEWKATEKEGSASALPWALNGKPAIWLWSWASCEYEPALRWCVQCL